MNKKIFYMFIAVLMFTCSDINAAKRNPVLTIHYSFTGIVDGCDYLNRMQVYIDGEKVALSTEKKQSVPNSISLQLKKGKHTIKLVSEVFYMGNWEEQSIANNYNIDAVYEGEIIINRNKTLSLLFDLDKGVFLLP